MTHKVTCRQVVSISVQSAEEETIQRFLVDSKKLIVNQADDAAVSLCVAALSV